MPVTAGDTMRVRFNGKVFGQDINLDLSYLCTVGNAGFTTAAVLAEVNNAVNAGAFNIKTPYLDCLPPQYILGGTYSQIVRPVRSAFRFLDGAAQTGTNAGVATVGADSAAIVRRTNLAGRNQVSTLKIGPAPDTAAVAGLLTNAYKALLATLADATVTTLILPITTCQFIPVILGPTGLDTGRTLTNWYIPLTARVMRRRVIGVGK